MERTEKDVSGGQTIDRLVADTSVLTTGLLTPGEVARLFGVDPKTVSRWADAGKLEAMRTLGGHRRYRADEVKRLLANEPSAF